MYIVAVEVKYIALTRLLREFPSPLKTMTKLSFHFDKTVRKRLEDWA